MARDPLAGNVRWRAEGGESAAERVARFRGCAYEHGLRLSRVYLLSPNRQMGLQGSMVMDCHSCGSRWFVRLHHAELFPESLTVIDELKHARDGQVTVPPGAPGGP
ncbi:MAG: hypothetical protein HY726_20130 [Candidatus Rokubacteria bacterium]|nr:hypothetical protein [Candidatus Rokubacteria bacterium]